MSLVVVSPQDLAAAVEALRGATEHTRVLAGGTDLMVELHTGRTRPDRVIDVARIGELCTIAADGGGLRIGARATCRALATDPRVRAHADLLARAACEVGAVQIQNRATVGGNLGTASPAGDLLPALLALGALVRLCSVHGGRELPIAAFLTGYRRTERRPDELIESVWIPPRPAGEVRSFRKVGTRAAQSIAKVVAALAVVVRDGRVVHVSGAAGSVADRPLLLPSLAAELLGRPPTPDRVRAAARRAARDDCQPIDDVRSTATYRREVLARILATMLNGALADPRTDGDLA